MLDWALFYASKSLPVFPVKPKGKNPLTEHGCNDASTDVEQIKAWWSQWPNANIGIATGAPLVVLDVDIDHDRGKYGDESLEALVQEFGPLPETWLCLTGGGGLHYYFYCDDPTVTIGSDLAPGLDFRGRGGYVVAPPSLHPSGNRYEWEASSDPADGAAPAAIPDWLLELIKGKAMTAKPTYEVPEAVIEGGRNQEMFRMACSFRGKGLTVEEITAAVMKINETRCKPPLTEKEIQTICMSAGRYVRGASQQEAKGPKESVRPPDFSDAGNAAVFSRIYQKDLIFADALGWLWWTGKKWERDDHKATEWAISLSERMLKEAGKAHREALLAQAEAKAKYAENGELADGEALKEAEEAAAKTKAFLTHAKNTRNAIRIKNMLELSKPALVIKADKLDANPFDLNTPAGIVNLETGRIRPHERAAYCSKITLASPGKKGIDMWSDFLSTITCRDDSVRGFLQLVAGMSLIGAVYQEGIIIAYGGGRNGKSTAFNAIGEALGDYTGSIDIKTITTDRANKGASLATLRGRRLVITGELEEHQRLSVATLKQLASTDKLVIEEKFRQPETVTQTHTLVLFTNHLPRVGSTDSGTWRRLIVVPFNATIPAGSGVQNFADLLVKEAGGAILSWAVEGAVNFVRNGFKLDVPDVVAEATEEYRQREDWLNNFIGERCVKEPNSRVGAAELYREYRDWAEATGDYVRRLNDFTVAMEAAGFQKIAPKNKRTWIGLRIDLEAKFANPYAATV